MRLKDDFKKMCLTFVAAGYSLTYMDEFVDTLLTEERACDIILPRLTKRQVLEELGDIGPRKSRLLDALDGGERGPSPPTPRSRSGSPGRSPHSSRSRNSSPGYISRSASRSLSHSPSRYRSRSRSISPDRMEVEKTQGD